MSVRADQNGLDRARSTGRRAAGRARRLMHAGALALGRATQESPPAVRRRDRISHVEALRKNGFTVFRGLFSPSECQRLAAAMKAEAGIQSGQHFTRVDATNHYQSTRQVLFDDRVVDAVRESIGAEGRFLQVSDLHYLHDTAAWHRDSVHRAPDASRAPDWAELDGNDFGVVKAILYLESDNAAMGIMCGSHRSPLEMDYNQVQRIEETGGQIVIDADDDPNVRFSEEDQRTPLAWRALPGDVLVFDERLYHAGRRVEDGKVSSDRQAAKFTLSLVFGADNRHSERMYSYFRYARREMHYRDLDEPFRAELAQRGLVLTNGWGNYYEQHPQDLRHAYLKKPETLEPLIAEFTEAGTRG